MGVLTILLLIPLIGIAAMAFLPGKHKKQFRLISLLVSLSQLVVGGVFLLPGYLRGEWDAAGFRIVEKLNWIRIDLGGIGELDINYHLGVDGISILMVFLTVIVMLIGTISAWKIDRRPKAFFMLFLLLNLSTLGCFVALDFFLFYLFYEFMLLPMFFLIGIWGAEKREYAAIKFFLYTLFGSVFMLLIMVGLAFSFIDPVETAQLLMAENPTATVTPQFVQEMLASGTLDPQFRVHSFSMPAMMEFSEGILVNAVPGSLFDLQQQLIGMDSRLLAFLVLFIGFAIKIPAVPLHTWLPDAHVQAPTAVSVVLAGILLKVGGYGILRICYGIFPEGAVHFAFWIGLVGVVSIVYGAIAALAQKDFKALIAYSSISHMGFVTLGIASLEPAGINGAVLQMFNHGIVSAALFLIVGVLYDRFQDRKVSSYTGLWSKTPMYAAVVIISFAASMGLPGLNSFISELLVLMGAMTQHYFTAIFAMLAAIGILLSAAYYLWTYRRMFFGKFAVQGNPDAEIRDLDRREYLMFVPLVLMMLAFGLMPSLLLGLIEGSVADFVSGVVMKANAFP